MAVRNVLAIDGGGVRGIVAAVLLDALDAERRALGARTPLADRFDLIAGTSTGAIIAAALSAPNAAGDGPLRTPFELRDLYRRTARRIFPARFWCRLPLVGQIRQFFGPLYDSENLVAVLREELGALTLSAARRNVMITGYAIDPRKAVFFRGGPDYAKDQRTDLMRGASFVDAVTASAAAPTFFPPHRVVDRETGTEMTTIDGGVFVNNPALAAFAEAAVLFPKDDIRITSIGSGHTINAYPFSVSRGWGFLEWLSPVGRFRTPLLSAIADGQSSAVNAQLENLIGREDFFRFDYDLTEGYGSPNLDDASRRNLNRLEQGALRMVEEMKPRLRALAASLG